MPPKLPIIVERTMGLDLAFGGTLAALSAAMAWRTFRVLVTNEGKRSVWPALLLAVCGLGLGTAIAIRGAGWQFRVEKDGVTLQAPFDFTAATTTIGWRDLESIWVATGGYRSRSYKLHLQGNNGREIVLQNADRLPGQLLQDAFAANAPGARGVATLSSQIESAAADAPWSLSAAYLVQH